MSMVTRTTPSPPTRSASVTTTRSRRWSPTWSHADALILLSDVDALYTGHPRLPESQRISDVYAYEELAGIDISSRGTAVGTGGIITKVDAAKIATSAGIPTVLTSAAQVSEAVRGQQVGTVFHPTGKRRPTRQLWLRHASDARGAGARRRRRTGGGHPQRLSAARRGDRGPRPVHRRRGRRPGRPAGERGGPRR